MKDPRRLNTEGEPVYLPIESRYSSPRWVKKVDLSNEHQQKVQKWLWDMDLQDSLDKIDQRCNMIMDKIDALRELGAQISKYYEEKIKQEERQANITRLENQQIGILKILNVDFMNQKKRLQRFDNLILSLEGMENGFDLRILQSWVVSSREFKLYFHP